MSSRILKILGTSSQFPTKERNQSGFFVRWGQHGFLFDPGEGTQQQMQRYGVSASQIDKIFITHFHGDHCLGLPGVIQRLSADGVKHVVEIYFPASGQKHFENLKNATVFHNQAHIMPMPIENEGVVFEDDELTIEAIELRHSIKCFGYRIREKDKKSLVQEKLDARGLTGPDVGRLKTEGLVVVDERETLLEDVSIVKQGKSFALVQDTAPCEGAKRLMQDVDLALIEATYLLPADRPDDRVTHLTVEEAAKLGNAAGAKKLVLTHFSARYKGLSKFIDVAGEIHPSVDLAQEGKTFTLK